jgi:uncharacterized membrane-anchored protein
LNHITQQTADKSGIITIKHIIKCMFEDAKKVIRIRKLKKGSQYNGQRRAVNTKVKEGQSIQWPKAK